MCHSTLFNAVNPCLGEIRSLICQPQGLHSVITLNPPPTQAATTQHHFTLWDLRFDGARLSVCWCVWRGELSAGRGDVGRHAKAPAHKQKHKHTLSFDLCWYKTDRLEGLLVIQALPCVFLSVSCVWVYVCVLYQF